MTTQNYILPGQDFAANANADLRPVKVVVPDPSDPGGYVPLDKAFTEPAVRYLDAIKGASLSEAEISARGIKPEEGAVYYDFERLAANVRRDYNNIMRHTHQALAEAQNKSTDPGDLTRDYANSLAGISDSMVVAGALDAIAEAANDAEMLDQKLGVLQPLVRFVVTHRESNPALAPESQKAPPGASSYGQGQTA